MGQLTSAVAAVIEDAAGRVLLCQQSQGHRLWGLPGGKIRPGESPIHAAICDIREETGMELEIIDLVGLYQLTGGPTDDFGASWPDVMVHVFRARFSASEATVNAPGRIRRLSWADPGSLPQPMTATTRTAIADANAGRSGVVSIIQRDAEPEVPDAAEADATVTAGALA
jgi:8-oxo-dGTP diphosphatase